MTSHADRHAQFLAAALTALMIRNGRAGDDRISLREAMTTADAALAAWQARWPEENVALTGGEHHRRLQGLKEWIAGEMYLVPDPTDPTFASVTAWNTALTLVHQHLVDLAGHIASPPFSTPLAVGDRVRLPAAWWIGVVERVLEDERVVVKLPDAFRFDGRRSTFCLDELTRVEAPDAD